MKASNGTNAATLRTARDHSLTGELARVAEGDSDDDPSSLAAGAVATEYVWCGSGLLKSATVDGRYAASFQYDAAGNRTQVTNPNLSTVTLRHTALGELHERRDSKGATSWSYDKLGRMTKRRDADGVSEWEWDPGNARGSLSKRCRRDAAGAAACRTLAAPDFKETRSYGGDARLDSIATTIRAGGLVRSYARSYAHDTHGRLLTVAHPSGLTVRRHYNARGYLSALKDNADMSNLVAYTGVNARGQATNESCGNGTALTRTFDAESGRLEGALTERGAAEIRHDTYKWRSDGLLESRADETGAAVRRETFAHDRLGRLTSAAAAPLSGDGSRTLSMTYDKLGSLKTRSSSAAGDLDMSVTALGGGSAAPGPTAAATATLGSTTHALGYDAGGRVTRDDDQSMGGTDRHFDWNARWLLRKAVSGDSLTDATPEAAEEYAYGPDGARHYRKSIWRDGSDPNNVTHPIEHRFYLDGFEERVGGGANAPRVETTRVAGAILHTRTTITAEDPEDSEGTVTTQTASISYLHRDHLGSARAVTNASGSAVATASYDPYGGRRLDDGSRESSASELAAAAGDRTLDGARGFTGHEQLDRIGLIHMGGRVCDPRLGRFLSPDPVIGAPGRSQSWNLYSYAGNSPMSFTDPTGLAQAPLPWEDDPCGGMLGCGNFDGGGGFGATSQRIASHRYHIYAGVVTFFLPSWSFGWGLEGGRGIGYNVVTVAYFFHGRTPTSVSASTPGDPEPAGRPINSAEDAAQQSGGSGAARNWWEDILYNRYLELRMKCESIHGVGGCEGSSVKDLIPLFEGMTVVVGAASASGSIGRVARYGRSSATATGRATIAPNPKVPADIRQTIRRMESGIKHPHRRDGPVFKNRFHVLPDKPPGYYREYVHPTPGVGHAGLQRIVRGKGGELYYTPDHYETFIPIR